MAGHSSGWTKIGRGAAKRSVFISRATMQRAGLTPRQIQGLSDERKDDLARQSEQPRGQAAMSVEREELEQLREAQRQLSDLRFQIRQSPDNSAQNPEAQARRQRERELERQISGLESNMRLAGLPDDQKAALRVAYGIVRDRARSDAVAAESTIRELEGRLARTRGVRARDAILDQIERQRGQAQIAREMQADYERNLEGLNRRRLPGAPGTSRVPDNALLLGIPLDAEERARAMRELRQPPRERVDAAEATTRIRNIYGIAGAGALRDAASRPGVDPADVYEMARAISSLRFDQSRQSRDVSEAAQYGSIAGLRRAAQGDGAEAERARAILARLEG